MMHYVRAFFVCVCVLLSTAAAADTVTYVYDALGRIVRATYASGAVIEYSYDAAGNRTEVSQAAPIGSIEATPSTIASGQSSALTWQSTFADSASIDQGLGAVPVDSTTPISVSPAATTTYTLTLTGAGGVRTRQATVTVP